MAKTSKKITPIAGIPIFLWMTKATLFLLILIVAYRFAGKVANLFMNEIKKGDVSHQKNLLIIQLTEILFYTILGFGIFIALLVLGVQTTTLLTLLGSAMVTIGIGLQGTLSNIFSGVNVALSNSFQIGDTIRVYVPFLQDGPVEGKVIDFNIAYVKLQDSKTKKTLYLSNFATANNVLVNLSRPAI